MMLIGRAAIANAVESAAHEMYAAGPWGTDATLIDNGLRCLTDSHDMDVYRDLARTAIEAYLEELTA